jgi:hypothetical protein
MSNLFLPYLNSPSCTPKAAIFGRSTGQSFDRGVDEREPDAYVRAFPGITAVPEHA